MNKTADQTLKLQSLDMTPVTDPAVTLAAERACDARRAWREAQQLRLLTARRAERLALELKAAEEQTEARIAAARAAALERRAALQRRCEAATRAERLERKLAGVLGADGRATPALAVPFAGIAAARAPRARIYVAVAAFAIAAGVSGLAVMPGAIALPAPGAHSASSIPEGMPGDPLRLKLSERLGGKDAR